MGFNITALHLRGNEGLFLMLNFFVLLNFYSMVNLGAPNLTCLSRVCPTGQRSSTNSINL